ncbi:MAG: putative metal-dependent hydrolase [Kiritimatiellia bacterium]|jgi:predicted metal-dependent hydrolase
MISVQTDPQGFITCRMHEAYLAAPRVVLWSLRNYLSTRRRAYWEPVAEFAQTINPTPPRTVNERTTGQVHDLRVLREQVNRSWFDGELEVHITWGRNPPRKKRSRYTSIHFGSYTKASNLIRIHPRLDARDVPEAFVRFVIYHEMLHIVIPPRRVKGRWIYHPPAFREAEQRFPDFEEMEHTASRILGSL